MEDNNEVVDVPETSEENLEEVVVNASQDETNQDQDDIEKRIEEFKENPYVDYHGDDNSSIDNGKSWQHIDIDDNMAFIAD